MHGTDATFLRENFTTGGRRMKDQVSIPEVREAIKIVKDITPVMNRTEFLQLIALYKRVLERYEKEEYLNGLPEE